MLLHALGNTFSDLAAGFELALVGALIAAALVGAEGLLERRRTRRVRTRVVIPKHYQAIGSAPLERHYGRSRVGL